MYKDIASQMLKAIQNLINGSSFLEENFHVFFSVLFPVASFLILGGTLISLLHLNRTPEIWAKLTSNSSDKPIYITHLENIIGRHNSCDIVIKNPAVSRQHASLIRNNKGKWVLKDLGSSHGIINNRGQVVESKTLEYGESFTLANQTYTLEPITRAEKKASIKTRLRLKPIPPWEFLILLTIIQCFIAFSLIINAGDEASINIIPSFLLLTIVMWIYFIDMRALGVKGFEIEIIAFYLCTLGLGVVGSYSPSFLMKQTIAIIVGLVLFITLTIFLRNVKRVMVTRWVMAILTILLLSITVILGAEKYGAVNWIRIGGVSLQPSELAKVCYILAGSATLERVFSRRNIILFSVLTLLSLGILAYCSDFGTAAIFFITFLVIAYLRSGSLSTIIYICVGAVSAIGMILMAKPYIFRRFSSWGHAWDHAATTGYQQINTQVAINHGGLLGVGPGKGMLSGKHLAAADTDLVFGIISEEYGLIIGLFAIFCILALAAFAIRSGINSRSTFYTIAACAATSLLVFQTALNVFGSVDILPLTGVTFPFISNGGSSMIMAWCVLAFLKAIDTRPNANFATKLKKNEQAPTLESLQQRGGRL